MVVQSLNPVTCCPLFVNLNKTCSDSYGKSVKFVQKVIKKFGSFQLERNSTLVREANSTRALPVKVKFWFFIMRPKRALEIAIFNKRFLLDDSRFQSICFHLTSYALNNSTNIRILGSYFLPRAFFQPNFTDFSTIVSLHY